MRCRNFPAREQPPHRVTYSSDTPSAKKYHCPDVPGGAKPDNTPYHWITTSVKAAERLKYEPCRQCLTPEAPLV